MDFKSNKKIYQKYNPNSKASDRELAEFFKQMYQQDPHFNLEEYFRKTSDVLTRFRQHYPKADMKNFREESNDGDYNIFWKNTAFGVFGDKGHMYNPDTISNENVKEIKKALGPENSFPDSLLLTNESYPIPGVPFFHSAGGIQCIRRQIF